MSQQEKCFYEFGHFRIDTGERVLLREGELVPLTQKLFEILLLLVENKGHIVGKDRLMREIWPNTFVEEGNLTQNISVLRKVLGDGAGGDQYIQTIARRGYRFVGSVRQVPDGDLELLLQEHSRARFVIEEEQESHATGGLAETIQAIPATPIKVLPGVALWRSRRAIVGATLFLLAISISGVFVFQRFRSRRTGAAPPFSLESYSWEKLSADDKSFGMISPDGEFIVYARPESKNALRQRRLAGLEEVTILPDGRPTLWGWVLSHDSSLVYYILPDQNRTTGILYRVSVLGGTPRKILERINGGPSLSPDDQRVAFMRYNFRPGVSALITANSSDGSDEQILETSDTGPGLFNPAWSPDGLRILCAKAEKRDDSTYWSLVGIPVGGGPVTQVTKPQKRRLSSQAWLPDGSGVVVIASDPVTDKQQLYLASYPDGSMRRITNDLNNYAGLTISADGNKLVTNQIERRTGVFVASANDFKNVNNIAACCTDRVAWTPDGRIVYDSLTQSKAHLWIMDADGANQQQLSPDNALDWLPSVSRDGRYIVFLSGRSGYREIWRTDLDGRNSRQLTNIQGDLLMPRIRPDGQMVYFSRYKMDRWTVARISIEGGEPEEVEDASVDLWDISPDGKRLAYSFFDEKLGRWRVAVRSLEGDASITMFDFAPADVLMWTPDGTTLIYKDAKEPTTLRRQPLTGGEPQSFLPSASETIYWADWSADGKHLAFVRGKGVGNIVMLKRSGY